MAALGAYFQTHSVGWSAAWGIVGIALMIFASFAIRLIAVPASLDREAAAQIAELTTLAEPASEFITVGDAAVWLYDQMGTDVRERFRLSARALAMSVEERVQSEIKQATIDQICALYGRWGDRLPWEPVDPNHDFSTFESLFGSANASAGDYAVRRVDLPLIRNHCIATFG